MKPCHYILRYAAIFLFFHGGQAAHAQQALIDSSGIEIFNLAGELSQEAEPMIGLNTKSRKMLSQSKGGNEKRLSLARQGKRYKGIAVAANNLGIIYYKEGDISKALLYFDEALKAREVLGDIKNVALIKGEIGYLYHAIKEYDKAINYYSSAINNFEEIKFSNGIALTSGLLGEVYFKKKEYNKALNLFQTSIKIYSELLDKKMLGQVLNRAGEVKLIQRNFDGALENFLNAEKIFLTLKDSLLAGKVKRNIAILYFQKEDYHKAESYLLSSLQLKRDAYLTEKYLKDTYFKLATKYKVENDSKKSFYYDQLYQRMKETLLHKDLARKQPGEDEISDMKLKSEIAEKEIQIEQLNKEKDQQYNKLSKNQIEFKQRIMAAEIEQLNKEKTMEDLNRSLLISERANLERDQQIEKLKNDKVKLDLVLAQNEKELYRKTKNNIILLGSTFVVLMLSFFVFNSYRYKKNSLSKLNQAYLNLQATQKQLIQSEKMASLGHLTAGIAHEIQNPLNFVNNFSELNNELLEELEEATSVDEKNAIITNLKLNLSRIHEHGKRADSIVKGMLAHSRANKEEKQFTDINKLIEEYFNLAYHGLRAKDPSFNCKLKKNLDPLLPPVNINQQDLSRVLLNLFNNAFYAINEKEKNYKTKGETHFQPLVEVETKKEKDHCIVIIKDNGMGIPENISNKIFNPFFTTKPPGAGTGLGLSLSYEIITKGHGGELKFESEYEKGTTFVINLPVNS